MEEVFTQDASCVGFPREMNGIPSRRVAASRGNQVPGRRSYESGTRYRNTAGTRLHDASRIQRDPDYRTREAANGNQVPETHHVSSGHQASVAPL